QLMKIIILLFIMFCLGWLGAQVARGQVAAAQPAPTVIAENDLVETDTKAKTKAPKTDDKTKSDDKTKTDAAPKSDTTPKNDPPAKSAATVAHGVLALAPEKANPVRIPRFETPPTIDGKLDDAVWKQAAALQNFFQINPGDNTKPSEPTEVFMGYDAHTLYIAFH